MLEPPLELVEGVSSSFFSCPGTTPPCPGGGLVLRPGARSRALLGLVGLSVESPGLVVVFVESDGFVVESPGLVVESAGLVVLPLVLGWVVEVAFGLVVSFFSWPGTTPPCPGGGLVLRPGARSRALLGFVGLSGWFWFLSWSLPGVVEVVELLPD